VEDHKDHDLLVRIDERIKSLNFTVEKATVALGQRLDTPDRRIDDLPQWRHIVIALGTAFLSIGAWVVNYMTHKT
jgi:hypothetical protein